MKRILHGGGGGGGAGGGSGGVTGGSSASRRSGLHLGEPLPLPYQVNSPKTNPVNIRSEKFNASEQGPQQYQGVDGLIRQLEIEVEKSPVDDLTIVKLERLTETYRKRLPVKLERISSLNAQDPRVYHNIPIDSDLRGTPRIPSIRKHAPIERNDVSDVLDEYAEFSGHSDASRTDLRGSADYVSGSDFNNSYENNSNSFNSNTESTDLVDSHLTDTSPSTDDELRIFEELRRSQQQQLDHRRTLFKAALPQRTILIASIFLVILLGGSYFVSSLSYEYCYYFC